MTDAPDMARWATWREIHAQPVIWRDWLSAFNASDLRGWIGAQAVDGIWFCGAGSSAYIGDMLAAGLGEPFRSVPTTDLVSSPARYLTGGPKLVVSFGRSGNSAETVGTLDALDALVPGWPRLNITCNADGALARRGPGRVVVLPEACHDRGFAMTSSLTTMLLTALALFGDNLDPAGLAATAEGFLGAARAGPPPPRAVYVGAGPLAFAARECALKVMELTAGKVPALWDSTLGFRHGPKSFVGPGTAVHVLLSAEPHAARYDRDLAGELRAQFAGASVTTIGPGGDVAINWPVGPSACALAVLPAQMQGVLWAEALGLNVDDPFAGQGTLVRVVENVRLYPVAV